MKTATTDTQELFDLYDYWEQLVVGGVTQEYLDDFFQKWDECLFTVKPHL